MNFKKWGRTVLTTTVLLAVPIVQAQQPVPNSPKPEIEDLGEQRYRIGNIIVDKAAGSFKVPGSVLREEPPVEFLVTTKGGSKNYESVIEADANAFEFNLACILIGLDRENSISYEKRQQGAPLQGDRVEASLSWIQDGKIISVPAANALMVGDPPQVVGSNDWVYTGSQVFPDGRYLADLAGTLLGVVHKGESVIEHKEGVAIGNYGSIAINTQLLPGVGEKIELTVKRLRNEAKP